MSPEEWRKGRRLSQDAVARLVGVRGRNPASTWSKWERGYREPPLAVVAKIEVLSDGLVDTRSWIKIQTKIGYTSITTEDGTVIVKSGVSGKTASGPTLEEALAELRRLETVGAAA